MNSGFACVVAFVFLPFVFGIVLLVIRARWRWPLPLLFGGNALLALAGLQRHMVCSLSFSGSFGVELLLDRVAFLAVLMSALVMLTVVLSRRMSSLSDLGIPLVAFLHGAVNAVFISHDLFNIFVSVELATIIAFLLIRLGNKERQTWSAIKYLIIGNAGMMLSLLGVLYAYGHSNSFSLDSVATLPVVPIALLVVGLSVKGGVWVMGLWLPEVHGEAESAVSALLSGVIVKVGVIPLLRIAMLSPIAAGMLSVVAPLGALYGVLYAVFAKDIKRMLAYHTMSQVGFILAVPAAGALYALAHGLFKSWLFLSAGALEERDLGRLKESGIPLERWLPLALGALAISGLPGLGAFGAKAAILNGLEGWRLAVMTLAALGTALSFAKLLFIPVRLHRAEWRLPSPHHLLVFGALVSLEAVVGYWSWGSLFKSLLLIALGWSLYLVLLRRSRLALPQWPEELEHCLGLTLLVLAGTLGVMLP
ncbi:MAG: hypothetical protein K9L28_01950 [Synergistales bacterium]|nr:hypothetical protein [Synergistales bacterium]